MLDYCTARQPNNGDTSSKTIRLEAEEGGATATMKEAAGSITMRTMRTMRTTP